MFSSISWSEYLTFIIVCSLIWYAFVLYTYYRHDILNTIIGTQPAPNHAMNFTYVPLKQPVAIGDDDYKPKTEEPDYYLIVQSFTDEVQAYFEEASKDEVSKDILLQSLRVIAGKYHSLGHSDYRESLHQFMINQAEINCAVLLEENEVGVIWS